MTSKFYVKFEGENEEAAIKSHYVGYDSVLAAITDTNITETEGVSFQVIDENYKVWGSYVTEKTR